MVYVLFVLASRSQCGRDAVPWLYGGTEESVTSWRQYHGYTEVPKATRMFWRLYLGYTEVLEASHMFSRQYHGYTEVPKTSRTS